MVGINIFTTEYTAGVKVFGGLPSGYSNNYQISLIGTNPNIGIKSRSITIVQFATLQTIHDSYSALLATKNYESVPNNNVSYMTLLASLKSINVDDSRLRLLVNIAQDSLNGAILVNDVYSKFAFNEIKIALLNKRIKEILTQANETQSSEASGQIQITQFIKLSPIYNYYVFLYGMPLYGVGFDPQKLSFLEKLPAFINA